MTLEPAVRGPNSRDKHLTFPSKFQQSSMKHLHSQNVKIPKASQILMTPRIFQEFLLGLVGSVAVSFDVSTQAEHGAKVVSNIDPKEAAFSKVDPKEVDAI